MDIRGRNGGRRMLSGLAAGIVVLAAAIAVAATVAPNDATTTPIKHLIVIIGENRSFDQLFATYVPPVGTVENLLRR